MNVIFLDIDGVLNSEQMLLRLNKSHSELGHPHKCECFRLERMIDDELVARLNRLIEATASKIVISSSWRTLLDPPELLRVLSAHGFAGEIIGETPDGPNHPEFDQRTDTDRGHEIAFWLAQHPEVSRFVILDDCSDMAHLKHRLVHINVDVGLTDADVELAIRMMSWSGTIEPQKD